MLDHNVDDPGHPFQPYGVTIGHLIEWSRLALHVATALGDEAPAWIPGAARDLYAAASSAAGTSTARPASSTRPTSRTGPSCASACTGSSPRRSPPRGRSTARRATRHTPTTTRGGGRMPSQHLVDERDGSWRHELDAQNRPSSRVWSGRPDVYHAYQATVLPCCPRQRASSARRAAAGDGRRGRQVTAASTRSMRGRVTGSSGISRNHAARRSRSDSRLAPTHREHAS